MVITDQAAASDIGDLESIIGTLGANPVHMTAAEHDDAVALVSHLPQVLAAALVGEATEHPAGLGLASGSFRDLTRVAASSPELWSELLVRNGGPLAAVLEAYAARLHRWADEVRDGRSDEIGGHLCRASEIRREMAPPAVAVAVADGALGVAPTASEPVAASISIGSTEPVSRASISESLCGVPKPPVPPISPKSMFFLTRVL